MILPGAMDFSTAEKRSPIMQAVDAIRSGRINRRIYVAGVVSCVLFFLVAFNHERASVTLQEIPNSTWKYAPTFFGETGGKGYDPIYNRTLGFQKIFAMSMPDRTDKRDALTLAGSASGIDIEFRDGVDGNKIHEKAYPPHWDKTLITASLGCMRAHMNVLNEIVASDLTSALLFEDDASWDVHFREQLSSYAYGARLFSSDPNGRHTPHSPYGDTWDMLWLGHCGQGLLGSDNRTFVMEQGPTVPRRNRRWTIVGFPDASMYPEQTRIMYPTDGGICLAGYAVSKRGARRLLQALQDANTDIDLSISSECKENIKCVGVWPPLVGVHKPMGSTGRDSDRTKEDGGFRDKGFTWDIVFDVRQNLRKLWDGDTDYTPQWPEDLEDDYDERIARENEERERFELEQKEKEREEEEREREEEEREREEEEREREESVREKEREWAASPSE